MLSVTVFELFTTAQAIPVILNLCVSNLILIGDHLQLQPFTSVNDADNTATTATHTRSLLERAVLVSRNVPVCILLQY
jgi:hypothetical protein